HLCSCTRPPGSSLFPYTTLFRSPRGLRLGIIKPWKSRWFAERQFGQLLAEDETIRKYLHRRLSHAAISEVEIERKPQKIVVTVHTARPGVVIGKRGAEVDKLRDELAHLTKSEVSINVEEVKRPELRGSRSRPAAGWVGRRSPARRATTRAGSRCTRCARTSTSRSRRRRRPTGRS